jgi:hypothetical protein
MKIVRISDAEAASLYRALLAYMALPYCDIATRIHLLHILDQLKEMPEMPDAAPFSVGNEDAAWLAEYNAFNRALLSTSLEMPDATQWGGSLTCH